MKKLFTLFILLFTFGFSFGQAASPLPYEQNFTTANDFTFVNGTENNKWAYGAATGNPASSIYVSDDNGVSNNYSGPGTSVVQAYKDFIIPAGTAIQNGRTSILGDNFCRDGYHLSYQIGRYTAACVWYEKLFGISALGNPFIPEGISEIEAKIVQEAARYAILNPSDITSLSDYFLEDRFEIGRSFRIYIGIPSTEFYTNNFSAVNFNHTVTGFTANFSFIREGFGNLITKRKSFLEKENLQIFDITGRSLFEGTSELSQQSDLNLNYPDSGFYIIRLGVESVPMFILNQNIN